MSNQLDLDGLAQAQYPIRVYCQKCCHRAEMVVGIEELHSLSRLRCSQCGASRDIKIEMLGADLGG